MSNLAPNQYPIFLSDEQRERLDEICRNGHAPAKKIRHAQVLLLSDRNRPEGRMTGKQIALPSPKVWKRRACRLRGPIVP